VQYAQLHIFNKQLINKFFLLSPCLRGLQNDKKRAEREDEMNYKKKLLTDARPEIDEEK
jgi:hypothetical protein